MNDLTTEECELIGALIGDGHIYRKNHKYIVGFTGHQITDKEYYLKLKQLIWIAWGKKVNLKFRENAIRIQFDSLEIVQRLIGRFKIPANKGKGSKVVIPEEISNNWNFLRHTLRGIVDTDGSIFIADKPGSPQYPSIEITTTSKKLAFQIREKLLEQGFRAANIWSYCSKLSKLRAYKIPLNGRTNLKKWVAEIGFSNPYKLNRALIAL
ncbi:MAG: hypothetical protein JW744_02975 [Candidatus Diapherotrites archaeon]|uniref:DOD-type homing endonuclease domain-containing protein n=1 Tax=Candidatus Iainarchaeum sp. TaxID=3101447 RepID=A0A938YR80_9ARCH|nr:hypothetical protein [Candidatus Diapherotrites archaeon]